MSKLLALAVVLASTLPALAEPKEVIVLTPERARKRSERATIMRGIDAAIAADAEKTEWFRHQQKAGAIKYEKNGTKQTLLVGESFHELEQADREKLIAMAYRWYVVPRSTGDRHER